MIKKLSELKQILRIMLDDLEPDLARITITNNRFYGEEQLKSWAREWVKQLKKELESVIAGISFSLSHITWSNMSKKEQEKLRKDGLWSYKCKLEGQIEWIERNILEEEKIGCKS